MRDTLGFLREMIVAMGQAWRVAVYLVCWFAVMGVPLYVVHPIVGKLDGWWGLATFMWFLVTAFVGSAYLMMSERLWLATDRGEQHE